MPLAACGQFRAVNDPFKNLLSCTNLLRLASTNGARILFLPEASDYIASTPEENVALARRPDESEFLSGLRRECKQERVACVVGVHEPGWEEAGGEEGKEGKEGKEGEEGRRRRKVRNVSYYINERGELESRYQKMHVFDVDIEGGPRVKESDTTEPGTTITPPFPTPLGLNLGMLICFDLRFPTPSLLLTQPSFHPSSSSSPPRPLAHALSYPSSFTAKTGRAHWSLLLRARAVETQSYVFAPAQIGIHNRGSLREASWGGSMIIDPWGNVVRRCVNWDEARQGGETGEETGEEGEKDEEDMMESICIAEVDVESVESVRRQVPLVRKV